jgi:nitrite reductase/ring-hydroxylating ferredoxin subunit
LGGNNYLGIAYKHFNVLCDAMELYLTSLFVYLLLFTCIGTVKGWQFGNDQKMACVNVEGTYYALQADCPRCAFDLFKGTVVTDEAFAASEMPRLACPTCSTTYGLKTGTHGPALKRTGLSGFVGGLAKTATVDSSSKDAKAYTITCDPSDGRVFCRER